MAWAMVRSANIVRMYIDTMFGCVMPTWYRKCLSAQRCYDWWQF
jgi:hypothetical protein